MRVVLLFILIVFNLYALNHSPVIDGSLSALQMQKLTASDAESDDEFGYSVAIDDDIAVIGAYAESNEKGAIYIYKRSGDVWSQQAKLVGSGIADGDRFGWSVSIDEDLVAVGAYRHDNSKGIVYIYHYDGSNWGQEASITASGIDDDDRFGKSVSLKYSKVLVGADGDDATGDSSGAAYVFVRANDGTWSQEAKLTSDVGDDYDHFGISVSLSNNVALIGAYKDDMSSKSDTGSAYIYRYDSSWSQEVKLSASDKGSENYFGYSVSIDGNTAVIGAYGNNDSEGSAYVYTKQDDGSWNETMLSTPTLADDDRFGISVAIKNNTLIVGSDGDDDKGSASGSAYIYTKHSDGSWSQIDKITASDGAAGDNFSSSVALNYDRKVLVGARDAGDKGAGYIYQLKQTISMEENHKAVAHFTVSDEDNDALYFYLIGDDASLFHIDSNANISFRDNPDYERPKDKNKDNRYKITFLASDNKVTSYLALWIDITDDGNTTDTDGDGLTDEDEVYTFYTNPNNADTDSDGLNDKEEVDTYHTDPKMADTDSDGLNDKEELDTYHTDPKMADTDSDGLNDKEEVDTYHTDPNNIDSDGDGLNDGEEIHTYHANPNNTDSDGDGLNDGDEVQTYHTNPAKADTDGDGLNDGDEITNQTDPNAYDNHPPFVDENTTSDEIVKLLASDNKGTYDSFGSGVSIDGDFAIVGAYNDNTSAIATGSAYIFHRDTNGTWLQVQKLMANDRAEYDFFGYSVAIDGDTAIVGAYGNYDGRGSVYIFQRDDNGTWSEMQKITALYRQPDSGFGKSISINNDFIIVGAYKDDTNATDTGSAYIFQRDDNGTWSQIKRLVANDKAENDNFGESVSVDGSFAVIGAYGDDTNATDTGSAYIFQRDGNGIWSQIKKLTASDKAEGDYFGKSVSIDNDFIIIGAYKDDIGATDTGSAYIFHRDSNEIWSQIERLVANDKTESDYFGDSVSINGNFAIVGAYRDDSYKGSAYIFQRDGNGNWSQVKKITASDGADGDNFGASVAVDDGFAVAGANQHSNYRGSSYIFEITHDASILENTNYQEDLNITDEDNDTITYSIDGIDSSKFSIDANATLTLNLTPDHESPEDNNSDNIYEVRVIATDDMNNSSVLHVRVIVIDNDDEDNDTISDNWERNYFGDLSHDGTADTDSDGLTDKEEYDNNTNPTKVDTDNDGLNDGEEVHTYHTDPTNTDSDGDDLNDKEELNTYHTDPTKADTDGDGSNDGVELHFGTDFNNTSSSVQLNSDANQTNGYIILTPNMGNKAGSAFITPPHDFNDTTGFNAHFKLEIKGLGSDADGMTFILQNDERNQNAVGNSGGGLGYSNINNSVAIAFKTYTVDEIRILKDGNMTSLASVTSPSCVQGGGSFYVWVDYRAVAHTLKVYTSQYNIKPNTPVLEHTIDLNATLKGRAFVGFSGATGGNHEEHDVYSLDMNWTIDSDKDGLTDKEESDTYHTNPNNTDTDSDGLGDYEEIHTYHTNPTKADTDGDGINDKDELTNGTDPNAYDNHSPFVDENTTSDEITKLLASDREVNDIFGNSVSIDGNFAIVGACRDDTTAINTGSAYIFQRDSNGTWSQVQKLTASDRAAGDYFGNSVSIDGDFAIVGAYGDDSWRGSVYIFQRDDNGNWSQVKKLTASDRARDDHFGGSVSIDGNFVIVGADGYAYNRGSAYIFQRDGNGNWSQIQKLTASDMAYQDNFGNSVSIDGNFAIVGACRDDAKGSAYIFQRDGNGNWSQVQKLTASDKADYDDFGYSVSIDGDFAIIGADEDDSSRGSAYIFQRDGNGTWSQLQKLSASDRANYDYFGDSVSIDGNFAIIGAYYDNTTARGTGSAYIFQRDGNGTWSQVKKLTASDRAYADYFGSSVAIDGGFAIIGAYGYDSYTGSSYIFEITHDISILENTNYQEDLNITDEDNDTITYTLGGMDSSKFSIDANATLTLNLTPDYENPEDNNSDNIYEVRVIATDDMNNSSVLHVRVIVIDNDDEDNDTISDNWERNYFGDLSHDGTADTDSDGLTDKEEYNHSTNPTKADTDGDGLTDKDELDTYHTDPTKADTDSDGLNDGDEVHTYHTDPTKADTDGDGLNDGEEVAYYADPNKADTDGDGLNDGQEVHTYHTSPTKTDSDDDGINDKDEVINGTDPNAYDNHSPFIDENITSDEIAKLLASDKADYDDFGYSVSIDGDFAIIGADSDDTDAIDTGSAYIFQRDSNGTWSQVQKLTANNRAGDDHFGNSVSIDGNFAIVGAYCDDGYKGSAYIFQKDSNGNWSQVQKLTANNRAGDDHFGNSVSIDGNFVIVGADGYAYHRGSVYIFQRDSNGNWSQIQKLTANDGAGYDVFGKSVAIEGDFAIVGADSDDTTTTDTGSAYIFQRDGNGNWLQVQKLTASDGAYRDYFGNSVSVDGDFAIVGAYYDNTTATGTGSAYIFQRDGNGTWLQVQKLTASDGASYDHFGSSVSIDDGFAIVGAYRDDSQKGSAYIFQRDGNGNWSQVKKLTASDGAGNDKFGNSVAVDDGFVIVGAYGDDDTNATDTGSSYIFEITHDISILENTNYQEDLNITDEDNDTITYTLGGMDSSKFSIDANATLTLNLTPDHETPEDNNSDNIYEVHVIATDDLNNSSVLHVRVIVTDNDDEDNDTISDNWERNYFGDLSHDGTADTDSDGLTDKEEYNHNTNPTKADTDNDGLTDKEELDTYHTDPTKADTDGDGVSDGDEVTNGTDPLTPSITITPVAYLFDTQSGNALFRVTNTGSSSITLPTATLEDAHSDRFSISNDQCSGTTLAAGGECSVTLRYPTSTDESLSTTLNISNTRAFIYNYESLDRESSRRLPPVIDSLNIPENMSVSQDYNLTFCVIGYDDDYTVHMAFFNCNGVAAGECGNSYGSSQRFDQALNLHPYLTAQSNWSYKGKVENKFCYSHVFTPSSSAFEDGNTSIVIRFYYQTNKDKIAGDPSISVIVPGNLSQRYYDSSGRKIEKTVVK